MTQPTTMPPRDNLLGICHALGQVFGFDPLALRIALTIGLLADFEAAVAAYALLGIAVVGGTLLARIGTQRIDPTRLAIGTKAKATELSATP